MKEQIIEALKKLDAENNAHWTQQGAPAVAVVAELSGIADVKRGDITEAAPLFSRETLDLGDKPADDGDNDTNQDSQADDGDVQTDDSTEATQAEVEGSHREQYDEAIDEKVTEAANIDEEIRKLKAKKEKAIEDADKLRTDRDRAHPPLSFAENIQQFQRSQQAQRAADAEGIQKLKQIVGTPIKGLAPASPLDASRMNMPKQGMVRGSTVKAKE